MKIKEFSRLKTLNWNIWNHYSILSNKAGVWSLDYYQACFNDFQNSCSDLIDLSSDHLLMVSSFLQALYQIPFRMLLVVEAILD